MGNFHCAHIYKGCQNHFHSNMDSLNTTRRSNSKQFYKMIKEREECFTARIDGKFVPRYEIVTKIPGKDRTGGVQELDSFLEGTPLEPLEYLVNPKNIVIKGGKKLFNKGLKELEERLAIKVEKTELAHATAHNGYDEPNLYIEKSADAIRIEKKVVDDSKPVMNKEIQGVKGTDKILLANEGKVGTYKELVKHGTAFDNITPHHMPSAEKMKQAGINRKDGVCMNMEQPHPGAGGRHRDTRTYGLSGEKLNDYLNLSYRNALANDIWDARKIYMKDGLYNSDIRKGLKEVMEKNKKMYPHLFDK